MECVWFRWLNFSPVTYLEIWLTYQASEGISDIISSSVEIHPSDLDINCRVLIDNCWILVVNCRKKSKSVPY